MTVGSRFKRHLILLLTVVFATPVFAQMVEVNDAANTTPATGKAKAGKYFQPRKAQREATPARAPAQDAGGAPRYLALHIGTFVSDSAYKWGLGNQEDIGELNAGLTYRLGEWVNSMDFALRVEYTSYSLPGNGPDDSAGKISVLPVITFPDANSRFPLYFGAGLGAGFFVKNIRKESALALDYQLFGGARFLNVIETLGFMAEIGLKNHLHILSDGQFNGVFINVGTVFTF